MVFFTGKIARPTVKPIEQISATSASEVRLRCPPRHDATAITAKRARTMNPASGRLAWRNANVPK